MRRTVVIIGAGMGGLASAIDLAVRGAQVTIVDSLPGPGGKAGLASVDGVRFDTGPSVLTMVDVFKDLLQVAGTRLADEVELLRPDPAMRYHYPDGTVLDVSPDMQATVDDLDRSLGPLAARELSAFLDYARSIWTAAAPHFIYGDAPTPGQLAGLVPTALRLLPSIDPLHTMNGAIEKRISDPRLRWLFQRFATYNGSDPRSAPATLNCIAHVEMDLGLYGVRGGLHELPLALARVASRLGVEFQYESQVHRIELVGGRATGVVLRGGARIAADAIVVNADMSHLGDLLPPEAARSRLPRPGAPSMSGWTALLKARRRPPSARPAHAVLFPTTYEQEFVSIFDHQRPPPEPTVYLCAQEKAHGRGGWADHEPLFVMVNAPAEPATGPSLPATWTSLRDVVLARLRKADLIDPADRVMWERSPTDLARTFPGSRGSIYGAASNDRWAAFKRPPNRLAIPGLYAASGSAHPGGGLPLCALSGRAAARAVAADLALTAPIE